MRIVLQPNATLSDVVVTGMQNMDKRLFTGSTTFIDAQDAKLDGVPDISRSLENVFKYKGFRLTAFIVYSFGNKVRLDNVFANRYSDMVAMPREFNNRWSSSGEEEVTTVPVIPSVRQNFLNPNLTVLQCLQLLVGACRYPLEMQKISNDEIALRWTGKENHGLGVNLYEAGFKYFVDCIAPKDEWKTFSISPRSGSKMSPGELQLTDESNPDNYFYFPTNFRYYHQSIWD